jgi:Ca2+-binding EF-hand superfamily protein
MMNNCWRINSHTTGSNEKKGWNNKEEGDSKKVYSSKIQDSYQEKRRNILGQSAEKGNDNYNNYNNRNQEDNTQGETNSKESVLLEKFRARLLTRGGRGIIGLARQFKIFDDNNSKTLDYDEFAKAIRDFKVEMGPNDIKVLFGIFDRDGEGSIDYNEFLRAVRGEMNSRRKKIVLLAFDKLDTDRSGIVEINEIKSLYNVKNHPDVKSGKKTEEDVYGEFLETFETHHNINRGTKDRRVTREEFLEYYNNISMSIDNDDYFEAMMTNAWKLPGATNVNPNATSKGWNQDYTDTKSNIRKEVRPQSGRGLNTPFGISDEPTNYSTSLRPQMGQKSNTFSKTGDDVLVKFREKLASRGTRGIMGIRRSFKICDDNNSGTIDFNEFRKLIKDYRIDLNEQDVKKLFGIFDTDRSGTIDYDEFVKQVVGEMNDNRKAIVKKAFSKLDKNRNGTVEIDDLRGVYSAKNHPDVKAGKKTEDEVLAEFLDNFEYHFSILVKLSFLLF